MVGNNVNAHTLKACIGLCALAFCQTAQARELSEADFLGGGEVTVLTASRLDQPIMDAPNAITVLDRATIEATGYQNLSDLFRLVPGVYVGQKKGWFHNVSHGMVDEYARRMQVLVDGRSVYLPSIGGVRWDTLPLAVDDIERIEVVRGPNAATFGANAFTGVINIITRHPEDVAGHRLHVVGGDHDHREGWYRWGGFTESASHRVTLGHREDGGFKLQNDDEQSHVFNYRGEFLLQHGQTVGLQAGYMGGTRGEGRPDDILELPHDQEVDSFYLQADYRRELSATAVLQGKFYVNHLQTREDIPVVGALVDWVSGIPGAAYMESDILSRRWHGEAQLNLDHGHGLRSAWGTFLRRDTVEAAQFFSPERVDLDSFGTFAHLEWRMDPAWLLNAGAFWEDYDGVGGRWSPRATLHWQPSPRHAFRVGYAKAYRNPFAYESEGNHRLTLLDANGNPLFTTYPYFLASGQVEPEVFINREIGYLGTWPELGLDVDVRVYREKTSNFINFKCPPFINGTGPKELCDPEDNFYGIPRFGAGLVPRDAFNTGSAEHEGFETQVKWRPSPHTQVLANYAFMHIDSHMDEPQYAPKHLAGLHLMHQFPGEWDLTLSHYWTSRFEPIGQGKLPSTTRLDARIAKRFRLGERRAQLALVAQNLGDDYLEFSDEPENLFDRRVYAQLIVDF